MDRACARLVGGRRLVALPIFISSRGNTNPQYPFVVVAMLFVQSRVVFHLTQLCCAAEMTTSKTPTTGGRPRSKTAEYPL
jgi:hypothetical protein